MKAPVNDYICVDLETTGLNPKKDHIIEIGAVKVCDGSITEEFSALVYPGVRLEEKITEITGLTDADLKNQPVISQVLPDFLEFAEELPLLGHSVLFDYSFLKKAAVNEKKSFERNGIDTLMISRKYLSQLESRSLSSLCGYFEIPHNAHRALEDAKATHILYQKLCENFFAEEDFKPQPLIYKVKKEGPVTRPQKERLYRLLAQHKLTPDYDVELLTKNEASRQIDKILAIYGNLQK